MIPPCAQNVLQSFGSAAFVMRRQRMPADASVKAVVRPAIPVPITSAGKCSRFFRFGKAGVLYGDAKTTRRGIASRRMSNQRAVGSAQRAEKWAGAQKLPGRSFGWTAPH